MVNFHLQKVLTKYPAALAQLGERQTEDLEVTCSIHVGGNFFFFASPS